MVNIKFLLNKDKHLDIIFLNFAIWWGIHVNLWISPTFKGVLQIVSNAVAPIPFFFRIHIVIMLIVQDDKSGNKINGVTYNF